MKLLTKINKPIGILFLIVSFSIIYIFFTRSKFDFTSQASYFQLYPSYDSIQISSFKPVNDSALQIQLFNQYPAPQEWRVGIDSGSKTLVYKGNHPSFTLQEGTHLYRIERGSTNQQIEIEAAYIPKGKWDDKNFTASNITILRSNLPSADHFPGLKKWQQYPVPLREKEKQLIASVLKDSILTNNNDTISKGEKISRYLCSRLSAYNGHMNDSIRKLSVCNQYINALKGAKIECGVYANIFSMFAQEAGVVNRIVELKHNFGTFNSNIHIFNEYFDEKRNRWVGTDIMLNNVNYKTTDGELLNAVQVKNFLKSSPVAVSQMVPFTDSIYATGFDSLNPAFYGYYSTDKDLYYYYDFNSQEIYSIREKAKRFFSKNPWYEVYSDVNIFSNRLFYLKQFLFALWLLLFIVLVISTLLKRTS